MHGRLNSQGFCGLVLFYKAWKWQCLMFLFLFWWCWRSTAMGGLMNLRVLYSTILSSLIRKIWILHCGLMILFTWSWCGQIHCARCAILYAVGGFCGRYINISLCTVYGRNWLVIHRLIVLDLQKLFISTFNRYNMFVKSFQQSCMFLSSSYSHCFSFSVICYGNSSLDYRNTKNNKYCIYLQVIVNILLRINILLFFCLQYEHIKVILIFLYA